MSNTKNLETQYNDVSEITAEIFSNMLQEINFNVDLNIAFKEIKFSKVHGLNISGFNICIEISFDVYFKTKVSKIFKLNF